MRLPTVVFWLLLSPPTSATPPNTPNRLSPRSKTKNLLPKQDSSSDCPTAYPTPRSSPPDTEPPYPIQITISPPDSNSQQAQDTGTDSDSDTTSQPRPQPPPKKRPQPPNTEKKRDSNPPPPVEIAFALPANSSSTQSASGDSGPCTLFLDLSSPAAQVSGAATVNVYALDGPAAGSLVGTTRFAAGEVATVDSFACREEEMCFRLEVADDDNGDGTTGVGFLQGDGEGMGLGMRYGC
ncbi:hypothetical protein C8A01DRAFT_37894 [Parachaetomium inaequale]|uniref:Uncharacterized protein n=1 Tax=Parachaetomium inaequale TaxID=2588326 RepID=A0AAN6PC17_9PEZI|nr:hypothetical protein C8A01DRAFT_37894 [Parachaetomium inaequale]